MVADVVQVYLTILPNWGTVKLSHIWRTGILSARRGSEQRSGYYSRSKKKEIFYIDFMTQKEMAWMKGAMMQNQAGIWGIPIWADASILSGAIGIGGVTIPVVDTGERHFAEGGECILIDPDNCEIYDAGVIVDLTDTSIEIDTPVVHAWGAGSVVYPVFSALIRAEQEMPAYTAGLSQISIEAVESFTGVP